MGSMIGPLNAANAKLFWRRRMDLKLLDWVAYMLSTQIAWSHISRVFLHIRLRLDMRVLHVPHRYGLPKA
uniref:Uncharacterized protein n=1 Tax=Lotus japonicus TaxID=34305 RepID=I3S5Q1_LOTJA|nr:unknown [Lotus japonicus]